MKLNKQIQFLLLLILGCVLIYFSIRNINLGQLILAIQHANFWMAIPVFAVSLLGYCIRSLRWKLLLQSLHHSPPVSHLFVSLSLGYAVNIATPRLGEVARCLVLKKTSRIPLEQSGISVVMERVVDVVSLGIIVFIAGCIQVNQSALFIQQQIVIPITEKLNNMPWIVLLICLVVLVMAFWALKKGLKKWWLPDTFIRRAAQSVKDILYLENKILFMVYTLGIWACYFLMTFLWFNIFAETQTLGLSEAFIIMAVGSIGRSVPIQGGGMGAYHYLVSNAFALFGVSLVMGNAMAFIIHGAQILFTFALGIVCWLWVLVYTRNNE